MAANSMNAVAASPLSDVAANAGWLAASQIVRRLLRLFVLLLIARLLGMEVVFIGGLDDSTFCFEKVYGSMPGITDGVTASRTDSFCNRMLGGAAA